MAFLAQYLFVPSLLPSALPPLFLRIAIRLSTDITVPSEISGSHSAEYE
jgi:hypothetical protein